MNFPEPKLGQKVREYISQELKKFLASNALISGSGILIKQVAGGKTISAIPSITFTGVAYVRGVKFTGLNSDGAKPWVKVDVAAGTATEQLGPPSDPFGDAEEWFYKASTAGDIHVTRFG